MTEEAMIFRDAARESEVRFNELVRQAVEGFRLKFGRDPQWITVAPGRVNIIGEHTDYNNGFVLPMAIERYVVFAAARPDTTNSRPDEYALHIHSGIFGQTVTIPFAGEQVAHAADWTKYLRGVLAGCLQIGLNPGPLDIFIGMNIPLASGLSSSAALETGFATLLEAVSVHILEPLEKILLCQKAEHEYAKVPCGIMDQFCATLGKKDHLLLLDCESLAADMVPFDDPSVTLLVINSNVKHDLSAGEYAGRRKECAAVARQLGVHSLRDATIERLETAKHALIPVLYRRARHVITEIQRTQKAAAAIGACDWQRAGALMFESHASLRDDFEVSCMELDLLVTLAQGMSVEAGGVIGSRMTGGGFGGCTVSLVRTDSVASIEQEIRTRYFQETGIEPVIFTTRPTQGAYIVQD